MAEEKFVATYESDAGEAAGSFAAIILGIPSIVASVGMGVPLIYELTANPVLAIALAIPAGIMMPKYMGQAIGVYYRRSATIKFKKDFIKSLNIPDESSIVFEKDALTSKYLELDLSTNTMRGHSSRKETTPGNPLYRMYGKKLYAVLPPSPEELWDASFKEVKQIYGLVERKKTNKS